MKSTGRRTSLRMGNAWWGEHGRTDPSSMLYREFLQVNWPSIVHLPEVSAALAALAPSQLSVWLPSLPVLAGRSRHEERFPPSPRAQRDGAAADRSPGQPRRVWCPFSDSSQRGGGRSEISRWIGVCAAVCAAGRFWWGNHPFWLVIKEARVEDPVLACCVRDDDSKLTTPGLSLNNYTYQDHPRGVQ